MAKAPTAPAARRTRPVAGRAAAPAAPPAKTATPAPVKPRLPLARRLPKFAAEVRQEARKITWPSWKETWITSTMVFVMVVFTAVFFSVVDGGAGFLIINLLKLAG